MLRKCIDHSAGETYFGPVLCWQDWLFDEGSIVYHFINGLALQRIDFARIFYFI